MERWGRLVARRRWVVLVAGLLTTLAAAGWGLGVFGSLSNGGFDDPDSESARAAAAIVAEFGQTDADILVLYTSEDGRQVDGPSFEEAVTQTVDALPSDAVVRAVTTYSGAPGLVSEDGTATLVPITLTGVDVDESQDAYDRIRADLEAPGLRTEVGGQIALFSDVGSQVEADIALAESITIPVVVILCLFIFGSLVSATLPALIGGIAIMGSFALLRLFTTVTDVSIFAINVITLLGVGLAIDYALFVVSRFREELASGHSAPDAITRTMATAGRTVMFSGLIVAVSLASLLLFPQVFLRSMGFGGMAAVLVAMVTALTVLPALLAVLGPKVDAGRMPWRRRRSTASVTAAMSENGTWARIARFVMRRPIVVMTTVVVGLLAVGLPFLRVEWTGVDERVLPQDSGSRVVSERLTADFPGQDFSHADVVVTGADSAALQTYARALGSVQGVDEVAIAREGGGTTVYDVSYAAIDNSAEGTALVEDLRSVPVPDGAQALVGGQSAQLVDLLASLSDTLPWMGLTVVLAMLVLLFLAFGSVVLPLKAIVVNAISVVASFGVVVWIFQDGNLSDFLGFTPLGALDAMQPILMLAILFGLSMDYEVFLLSRIREQWDRGVDNTTAVATGLQQTGSIITSAALLLAVVIGAFATSGVTFIKMIGIGMLVAILVDATVVRTLLVPAAMRLMGRANWWAPAPLARWWQRYGFRESSTPEVTPKGDSAESRLVLTG